MMMMRRRRRPRQDRLVAVVVDGLLPEEHHGGVLALGDLPEQLGPPRGGCSSPSTSTCVGSVGPHGQGGPEGVLRDRPKGSGQQREVESEAAGIEGRGGGRGPSGGDGA